MNILARFVLVSTLLISFTVKAHGLDSSFTSFAGFKLGTVKLSSIENKLGKVKLVETGDAGEYTASICYSVPSGVILFFAGELDGPEHNLGGFGFAKDTKRQPCLKWPMDIATPSLEIGGLRIGLTLKEFTNIVGTSVRLIGNKAYAFFEDKRIMTEEEISRLPKDVQKMVKSGEEQNYFDVVVSVVATFYQGRIVDIRIWKTETT